MTDTNSNQPDAHVITDDDVADGLTATRQTFADTAVGENLIVDGYGLAVRVSRGELELVDGIGEHRRTRHIARAQAAAGRVRRVLVLGSGVVTTDAVAWCDAIGVALVIAGPHGEALSVSAATTFDHGGLRRSQALAAFTPTGMSITHYLLERRLADQSRVCRTLLQRTDRADAIDDLQGALLAARTSEEAMIAEMQAAEHYWAAWADEVRLTFVAKDRPRIPERWTRFGGRSSPLGEAPTNRHAATPLAALLNYGIRLAEIEATLGCRALGLDPGIGLAHAVGLNRPSMVLDLVEAARGTVEQTVIQMATHRSFRKADFAEALNGEIRIVAPLTHDIATSLLPTLRTTLGPVVEYVAAMLAAVADSDVRAPTPLTRARHRAGRDATTPRQVQRPALPTRLWACPDCGGEVTNKDRIRCDPCIDKDPRQTPEIRGHRAKAIAARHRISAAWEAGGGHGTYDPDAWPGIVAGLANVKLADIVLATGLSKSFASAVRAGKYRPHPSHWPSLARLAEDS